MKHPKKYIFEAVRVNKLQQQEYVEISIYDLLKKPNGFSKDHVEGAKAYTLAWLVDQVDAIAGRIQSNLKKCNCGNKK